MDCKKRQPDAVHALQVGDFERVIVFGRIT